MRVYPSCYFYFYQNKRLTKCKNTACWGGVFRLINVVNHIYIAKFSYAKTKDYQNTLLSLINKITPCEIVTIRYKSYIKYRLLSTYDQNLILLNFIRNLWHEPIRGYTKRFFEALEKSKFKDPLQTLTWANQVACGNFKSLYSPGHSNIHRNLKIKTTDQLLKYYGCSTFDFLTTEA